jgi:hypothetical protein
MSYHMDALLSGKGGISDGHECPNLLSKAVIIVVMHASLISIG